ncbi:MAG: hypothetical protein IKB07_13850, partial [Lachnospiraceae bacterium]|nr:hypothetical protein [Lachnospiraceae bacterium]
MIESFTSLILILVKIFDVLIQQMRGVLNMVVKVGVAKLGNIAAGVMAELLLDERADREDMMTFMATSGTKLQKEDVDRVVSNL